MPAITPSELSYQKMCFAMAFDLGIEMEEQKEAIYELSNGHWQPICIPDKIKGKWYYTWKILKKRIEDSDFRFKKYW
jgi:hypothetical protein